MKYSNFGDDGNTTGELNPIVISEFGEFTPEAGTDGFNNVRVLPSEYRMESTIGENTISQTELQNMALNDSETNNIGEIHNFALIQQQPVDQGAPITRETVTYLKGAKYNIRNNNSKLTMIKDPTNNNDWVFPCVVNVDIPGEYVNSIRLRGVNSNNEDTQLKLLTSNGFTRTPGDTIKWIGSHEILIAFRKLLQAPYGFYIICCCNNNDNSNWQFELNDNYYYAIVNSSQLPVLNGNETDWIGIDLLGTNDQIIESFERGAPPVTETRNAISIIQLNDSNFEFPQYSDISPTPQTIQLQNKTVTVTRNGTQIIYPDYNQGWDGLNSVTVTTNIPTTSIADTFGYWDSSNVYHNVSLQSFDRNTGNNNTNVTLGASKWMMKIKRQSNSVNKLKQIINFNNEDKSVSVEPQEYYFIPNDCSITYRYCQLLNVVSNKTMMGIWCGNYSDDSSMVGNLVVYENNIFDDMLLLNMTGQVTPDDPDDPSDLSVGQIVNYPISGNGVVQIPIPNGYDAVDFVSVNVNVPQTFVDNANVTANNIITENDTYMIPSGKTGFNGFTVNVPQSSGGSDVTVQPSKTQTITSNHTTTTIEPDSGYDSIGKVIVNTNIPDGADGIQARKDVTITNSDPVLVTPDSEFEAMRSVYITNNSVPSIQTNRTSNIVSNGTYVIRPSNNNDVMDKVTVTVNVPDESTTIDNALVNGSGVVYSNGEYNIPEGKTGWDSFEVNVEPEVEENKTIHIDRNYTGATPYRLTPSSGYDGIGSANIYVDVPQSNVGSINKFRLTKYLHNAWGDTDTRAWLTPNFSVYNADTQNRIPVANGSTLYTIQELDEYWVINAYNNISGGAAEFGGMISGMYYHVTEFGRNSWDDSSSLSLTLVNNEDKDIFKLDFAATEEGQRWGDVEVFLSKDLFDINLPNP